MLSNNVWGRSSLIWLALGIASACGGAPTNGREAESVSGASGTGGSSASGGRTGTGGSAALAGHGGSSSAAAGHSSAGGAAVGGANAAGGSSSAGQSNASGNGSGGAATAGAGGSGTAGMAGAVNIPGSYTTDFNLTESPLSEAGVWKHTGLDWTRVATAGGLAFGTQTGSGGYDDSYAYLSGFPPDQTASGVVHLDPATGGGTTHEVEILLRWADSEHSARGYECNFAYNGQYADIVRWNGAKGDFTFVVPSLTASIPGGMHDGDTVSAKIVGHTITTYINGKQILSVSDSTFNDGNPGMGFWRGAPSGPMNDYGFTRFTASPVVP
jgi:hypothetical protein